MTTIETGYALSPRQRQRWRRRRGGGVEAVQLVASRPGGWPSGSMASVLGTLLARHEALRTAMSIVDGFRHPLQEVGPADVGRVLAVEPPEADVEAVAARQRAEVDGVAGVPFRCAVVGDQLVLTADALAVDRRSLAVVADEAAALLDGRELPAEGIQPLDFATWHQDVLDADDRPADAVWREAIRAEVPEAGEGPSLLARVRLTTSAQDLDELVRTTGLDPTSGPTALLLATWAAVLGRALGREEVAIDVLQDGRPDGELGGAVGPFAVEVPLLVATGDLPFVEIARAVDRTLADLSTTVHLYDPDLDDLEARLRRPGFELVAVPGAVGSAIAGPDGAARHQLSVTVHNGTLSAVVGVADAVIRADTLARCLDRALVHVVRAPEIPVEAIDLVGEDADDADLSVVAAPDAAGPAGRLHDAVRAQATRTPRAVAVRSTGRTVTYEELVARAAALADQLRRAGVGPGTIVPILADRTPELVVALVATSMVPATAAPIDADMPVVRVRALLDVLGRSGGRSPVLVTGARVTADVARGDRALIDLDDPDLDAHDVTEAPAAPGPGAACDVVPAYVMFTSGSTGTPRGVVVPDAALLNYLCWAASAYGAAGGSVVHSSVGFDLTVTPLLAPLVVGGTVELIPGPQAVVDLARMLREPGRTALLKVTPTHAKVLHPLLPPGPVAHDVDTIVVGGEVLTSRLVESLRSHFMGATIVNEYGPTETVVGSSAFVLPPGRAVSGSVPVGEPIAGTSLYVLDNDGRPVPVGVAGELHIGGVGVTEGYLDDADATAAAFPADVVRGAGRMYRTGDRVRLGADGQLRYLGRLDEQLKVRGVRIDPLEVEAALTAVPGVADAAVAAVAPDGPAVLEDMDELVAYVVADDPGSPAAAAELAEACREVLPSAMVPSEYVTVAALPTTPNGKLDREALPRPSRGPRRSGEAVPPRSVAEEVLAAAVATTLGLAEVSIDDDYFQLGGDSIRSVMIVSQARARGIEATAADLHELRTIRRCAEAAEARAAASGGAPVGALTEPFGLISVEDRTLVPEDVEDAFPLSLLQEGMIFHRAFAAKSAVYHAIASIRIDAPLDVDLMRLTVNQLVARHPMLRTSFDQRTFSVPLQLVHRTFDDPFAYEDLREVAEEERDRRVTTWIDAEKARGFELDDHPLIRFKVHQLGDELWQFTYGFHHEIVDGWSEALMMTELFTHYFSLLFGEPIDLREPTSTMRDAVALEKDALSRPEDYAFWEQYLEDASFTRLPRTTTVRADDGSRDIKRLTVAVPTDVSDRLKELARSASLPLKNVLLASHMFVMSRYGGTEDTLSYTVTQGRPETGDGTSAIGLFVNSLALRVPVGRGTWRELAEATLASEVSSMPHRRLPMAELKRHQGNEPLAETLFFFTDYHIFKVLDRWRARGVKAVDAELYGESTFPFCAIFRTNRDSGDLEVRLEYDALQFTPALMDGLVDMYQRVLEAIVEDPDARYDDFAHLPARDRAAVERIWEPRTVDEPATVPELIAEAARRAPDAVAVEVGEEALTYGALLSRAATTAAALRGQGVGPESVVAVEGRREIDTIVAIVAVLWAGGAYLPLDPGLPDGRAAGILASSGAVLVVGRDRDGPTPTVTVDELVAAAGAPVARTVGSRRSAAYVISTSGSTGEPKGVVVSHDSLARSTAARPIHYDDAPVDRFLLLSPLSFDSSVAGLFWTLTEGATLVLPEDGVQPDALDLARLVDRRRATHVLAIPSLYGAVLDAAPADLLTSLELVICAGEACAVEVYDRHAAALPETRFENEYGPTEAAVWCTAARGRPGHQTHLSIGEPVGPARVAVLDGQLRPAPVGVPGELYIGGEGLARGYVGRPGATAERFVPSVGGPPGSRAYRSGDVARINEAGELEFLGRTDDQVRVSGFRVEPAEVEAVLEQHPDVRRSVVVPRLEGDGTLLVAHVVAVGDTGTVDVRELQRFLRGRLPRYMVPSRWSVVDRIPTTSTGKVDRRALADRPGAVVGADRAVVEPRTPTEHLVADLWRQVLGLDRVGVDDDFFELGGESLRAMQLLNKLNRVMGTNLSVRYMFDATTVAAQAERLDRSLAGGQGEADGPALATGTI